MANELSKFAEWTFMQECSVPKDVMNMMVNGEQPYAAFKTVRDVAVFTNFRLVVRDSQGITGKKIETYSLPWKSVDMWSSENAGHVDINTEMEFWTRAGHVKVNLKKGIDIRRLDAIVSACVLSS